MELSVNNLSKTYGSSSILVEAAKNLSFSAHDGEIIGLVGANGAGKTTLIKMICNLINPSAGSVCVDGNDIRHDKRVVEEKIGVVLEGARNVYNFLTVQENIEYFSYLNGLSIDIIEKESERLLKLFGLEDKKNDTVNELSRGMQQKVAIMIALIKNPEILIMDEPTLGLDIIGQIRMREVISQLAKEEKRLVLICTHDMELVRSTCTRALCFQKGEIIKDINLTSSGFLESKSEEMVVYLQNCLEIRNAIARGKMEVIQEDDEVIEVVTKSGLEKLFNFIDLSKIIKIEKRNTSLEKYLQEIEERDYDNKKSIKS